MLTSLASIQLESDSRRFGNPNRFIPVGKCSRWKYSVSNFYDGPFDEPGHQRAEQDCRYDAPSY
ncbi:MAG TPA: hypothetical protein VFZ66_29475, partial [Herpetosiphonaceae bacterium]